MAKEKRKGAYMSWVGMRNRCYYAGHIEFHRYGGRGIAVCPQWRDSFDAFLRDMGERPEGMTLDRYPNNDGDYEPGNCRWATRQEQGNNRLRNVRVSYDGRDFTLKQLASYVGVNYFRLHAYFRRRGLSLEAAIAKAKTPGINRPYRYLPGTRAPGLGWALMQTAELNGVLRGADK